MHQSEMEMYLDEYSEFIHERSFDANAAILAALYLEEVFDIRLDDDDITFENLGSIHGMRRFLMRKLNPGELCAASAE